MPCLEAANQFFAVGNDVEGEGPDQNAGNIGGGQGLGFPSERRGASLPALRSPKKKWPAVPEDTAGQE
jgi:hypothetical protein